MHTLSAVEGKDTSDEGNVELHFVTLVNQSLILSAVLVMFNIHNSSAASSTLSSDNWLSLC